MEEKFFIYADAEDDCTCEVKRLCDYLNSDRAIPYSRKDADCLMLAIVNWFIRAHKDYRIVGIYDHKIRLMMKNTLQATIYNI